MITSCYEGYFKALSEEELLVFAAKRSKSQIHFSIAAHCKKTRIPNGRDELV